MDLTPLVTDMRLRPDARGVAACLIAQGQQTFTQEDVERCGVGRDRAYRILTELRAAEYIKRAAGGYTFLNLSWFSAFPEKPEIRKSPHVLDHDLESKDSWQFPENPENQETLNHNSDDGPEIPVEVNQQPLQGLPGNPNPPVAAAPPSPRKLRAPKATPEQAAIRQALRAAAEWGPSGKANKQATDAGDALMREDPGVTPERIAAFARRWFPRYSPIAALKARNGERAERPTPEQVLRFWPSFVAWEQAQRAAEERERAQREPEPETPAPRRTREDLDKLHPFRGRLGASAPSPRPAMTAMGRRS